jgi:hypothetical protein
LNQIEKSDLTGITEDKSFSINPSDLTAGQGLRVENGDYTARIYAEQYHTGGFYVACFRRVSGKDANKARSDMEVAALGETLKMYGNAEKKADKVGAEVVEVKEAHVEAVAVEKKQDSIQVRVVEEVQKTVSRDTVKPKAKKLVMKTKSTIVVKKKQ